MNKKARNIYIVSFAALFTFFTVMIGIKLAGPVWLKIIACVEFDLVFGSVGLFPLMVR